MRSIRWSMPLLAALCLPLASADAAAPAPAPAATKGAPAPAPAVRKADPAQVKRGEYLVTVGGCNDCHTPMKFDPALGVPVPDRSRAFSGHPTDAPDPEGKIGAHDMALIGPTFTSFALPFGKVYAANITSDKKSGIGDWSEAMFVQAMRTGRTLGVAGNRPILPPMPWTTVASYTDEDLKAIFAFLQSTKPIQNVVKQPSVPNEVLKQLGAANDKIARAFAPAGSVTPAAAHKK